MFQVKVGIAMSKQTETGIIIFVAVVFCICAYFLYPELIPDDPIKVCKHKCYQHLNTNIRTDTRPFNGGLYHCSCDDKGDSAKR